MRILKNWITSYLFYTEHQESPNDFHKWCAMSLINATLERRCWVDMGYFRTYPNLYVILIGASAAVRKTKAIEIAQDLLNDALPEMFLFSQKITTVAIISFLKNSYEKRKVSGGFIIAEELSVFLGNAIQDATLVQMLTKLYGCPKIMDYSTQSRGREEARLTFCNLLGGTTPEWLKDSFPPHAIGGGFAGRIVFVYKDKTEKPRIAVPVVDDKRKEVRGQLIEDLKEISLIEGEFKLTKSALEWYTHWYESVFDPDLAESDLKGYYGRKQDLVLKLGMALCVSRNGGLMISRDDIIEALYCLAEVEKMMPETLRLIQSSESGQMQHKILNLIRIKEVISRTDLMRKMSYQITARELDELLLTLSLSGRIATEIDGKGVFYKLKSDKKS